MGQNFRGIGGLDHLEAIRAETKPSVTHSFCQLSYGGPDNSELTQIVAADYEEVIARSLGLREWKYRHSPSVCEVGTRTRRRRQQKTSGSGHRPTMPYSRTDAQVR